MGYVDIKPLIMLKKWGQMKSATLSSLIYI